MRTLLPIVVRNSFFGAFGKLGVKVISFAFTILIVRWLGDEKYGQYTLIWSYITIFAMFSDAGLGMYLVREIAKERPDSQFIAGNIIAIRLILAMATVAIIVASAWILDYSAQFLQYVFLAGLILLLYAVQDPLDAVLQAKERFDLAASAIILGQLVFVSAGLIFLLAGWDITGLIVAALLNVFVSMLLAWHLLSGYRTGLHWRLKPGLWPRYIKASFSFGLIKLWLSWSLRIDIIILGWFWMDQMIGWYGAAYAIITGMLLISSSINTALYPTLSRQYIQDPDSFSKIYGVALKYLLIISLPIAGGIFLTADKWVNLLYGNEFAPTTAALSILVLVVPWAFVSELFRYVLLVTEREHIAAQILGLVIIFSLAFNLWLIPLYGYLAAAIIAVIAEALLVFLYTLHLRTELQTLNLVDAVLKPVLAALVLIGVTYFFLPDSLFLQVVFGGLAYIAAIWWLQAIKPDEYRPLFASWLKRPEPDLSAIALGEERMSLSGVSVFVPAYNADQFLSQTIESVLNQTYQNFELIIIDDGSTDDTAHLLAQYREHPKIRIYHNAENLGMAPTWNLGLSLAQYDLVAKLDADDFYEPQYLQTVVEFFQKHKKAGLVFSGLNLIYPDGRVEPEMKFLRSWVRDRETFLPSLLQLCVIRSPTVCVRRACYEKLGDFIEQMRIHTDWEMWVRIVANYQVGYIARRLANYRINHGTNVTIRAAMDGRSMQDIRIWLDLLQSNQLPYQLSTDEEEKFRWGIYELEMHFAALAAYHQHPAMQEAYTTFAEQVLPKPTSPAEMERIRQVYTNLHQGLWAFRAKQPVEARRFFIQAIRTGPKYCTSLWIWNKLLLTFLGKTNWGVIYK